MKNSPDRNLQFMMKAFRWYYQRYSERIDAPSSLENREFGFTFFRGKGMIRHVSFRDAEEFRKYLVEKVPQHAFYSSAYYRFPSAETMDEKEWLGADLIFDIDVDHIDTPCKVYHDSWLCPKCGASGRGAISACPHCGNENIKRKTWVCNTCLSVARDEVIKLIDFLLNDFGFSQDELYVTFSGHRGFHVHVESEAVRSMDQDLRREISDYVRGVGLVPEAFTVQAGPRVFKVSVDPEMPGWHGRIARYLLFWLLAADEAEVSRVINPRKLRYFDEMKKALEKTGDLSVVMFSRREISKILEIIAEKEGVKIDERVTIDIKRLIRLPGSLHGKTGLQVSKISVDELENKDVIRASAVLGDRKVKVMLKNPPEKVLDHTFPPDFEGVMELPLYLVAYLIGNGAEIKVLDALSSVFY